MLLRLLNRCRVRNTYCSVFAKSLLEVAVSGLVAKTRDVKIVAWVVVTTVGGTAVSAVVGTRAWRSVECQREACDLCPLYYWLPTEDGLHPRCAWESAVAHAHGEEGWQHLWAKGFGHRSKRHCRSRERRHGQRRRSIAELLCREGKGSGRIQVSHLGRY